MRPRTLIEIIAGDDGPAAPPGGESAWRERLAVALDTLSPPQARVIRERYLGDSRPTLADVGAALGVTRSRIWTLENEALKKLRHPSRRRYLMGQGDLLAAPWRPYSERRLLPVVVPPVLHPGLDLRDRLLIDLRDLDLSVRAANRLEDAGLRYVGDVVRVTEVDLVRIKYFGRKTLREINALLQALGLSLGMKVPGWARMKATKVWRMTNAAADAPTAPDSSAARDNAPRSGDDDAG
jgi:hypothetical protein